ncbi:unnamed protein product [Amoebophrya sp. A25]|nr:unnamed protein product [Amoebophrya sp. A25]|eukprot:GSA25T00019343001.1
MIMTSPAPPVPSLPCTCGAGDLLSQEKAILLDRMATLASRREEFSLAEAELVREETLTAGMRQVDLKELEAELANLEAQKRELDWKRAALTAVVDEGNVIAGEYERSSGGGDVNNGQADSKHDDINTTREEETSARTTHAFSSQVLSATSTRIREQLVSVCAAESEERTAALAFSERKNAVAQERQHVDQNTLQPLLKQLDLCVAAEAQRRSLEKAKENAKQALANLSEEWQQLQDMGEEMRQEGEGGDEDSLPQQVALREMELLLRAETQKLTDFTETRLATSCGQLERLRSEENGYKQEWERHQAEAEAQASRVEKAQIRLTKREERKHHFLLRWADLLQTLTCTSSGSDHHSDAIDGEMPDHPEQVLELQFARGSLHEKATPSSASESHSPEDGQQLADVFDLQHGRREKTTEQKHLSRSDLEAYLEAEAACVCVAESENQENPQDLEFDWQVDLVPAPNMNIAEANERKAPSSQGGDNPSSTGEAVVDDLAALQSEHAEWARKCATLEKELKRLQRRLDN